MCIRDRNELQLLLGQVACVLLAHHINVLKEIAIAIVLLHFLYLIKLVLRIEHLRLLSLVIFFIFERIVLLAITWHCARIFIVDARVLLYHVLIRSIGRVADSASQILVIVHQLHVAFDVHCSHLHPLLLLQLLLLQELLVVFLRI